jgi:hypothetical protein
MAYVSRTYERLTVNLVERAVNSLALAAGITGDSKTDTVNRALQAYAYFLHERQMGNSVVIRRLDGTEFQVEFL